jgi:hypothetical protein
MYGKQKGDGFTLGVALALSAASFVCTVSLIKDFYKPAE